jgi:hypothetical protein
VAEGTILEAGVQEADEEVGRLAVGLEMDLALLGAGGRGGVLPMRW